MHYVPHRAECWITRNPRREVEVTTLPPSEHVCSSQEYETPSRNA